MDGVVGAGGRAQKADALYRTALAARKQHKYRWVQHWVQNSRVRRSGVAPKRHRVNDLWILD